MTAKELASKKRYAKGRPIEALRELLGRSEQVNRELLERSERLRDELEKLFREGRFESPRFKELWSKLLGQSKEISEWIEQLKKLRSKVDEPSTSRSWIDPHPKKGSTLLDFVDRAIAESASSTGGEPDDAPELTQEKIERADLYHGDKLIRRGRPPSDNPKQALKLRIDPDVVEHFRAAGPGWQTRINDALRRAAKLPRRKAG